MKILILGSGMMGRAIAYDLCKYSNFNNISIVDKDERILLLDCKDLEFISSAGLRTLLGILKKMATVEGTFSLCSLSDKIKRVFELSGFLKLFPVYDNREEAIKDLA